MPHSTFLCLSILCFNKITQKVVDRSGPNVKGSIALSSFENVWVWASLPKASVFDNRIASDTVWSRATKLCVDFKLGMEKFLQGSVHQAPKMMCQLRRAYFSPINTRCRCSRSGSVSHLRMAIFYGSTASTTPLSGAPVGSLCRNCSASVGHCMRCPNCSSSFRGIS